MSTGFSQDFKELVRTRTDLVGLIGETVSLSSRNGGRDFLGLCPFHDDHNPSFHVYPDQQRYRCWVCNEAGDCFSFVMKHDALEFRGALEMLAKRAGVEIPQSAGEAARRDHRDRAYDVLAWAEREFHQYLIQAAEAKVARDYLAGRGFTGETVKRFRLGFHPKDWQWIQERARGKFTTDDLFAARLVRERQQGNGFRDDFVNRVLFPIHDERGRAVAFGGRVLPGDDNPEAPKYLNSPESPVFAKSRLLYGLDYARDAIRRCETVVVVEGYTDCITAHQCGVQNVVGTLGTALTETHVSNLKRFARRVVLVYDGDAAGQMATERALAKFLVQEVDLRILTLPAGKDPADVLLGEGGEAFSQRVEAAIEAWDHKLQSSIARFGLQTPANCASVIDDILGLLAQMPRLSPSQLDVLLGRLARRVGAKEINLRAKLTKMRSDGRTRSQRTRTDAATSVAKPLSSSGDDALEQELLEVILAAPEKAATIQQHVSAGEYTDARLQQVLQLCYDFVEQGDEPTCERITAALEDADLRRLVVHIDLSARQKNVAEKVQDEVSGVGGTDAGLLQQILRRFEQRRRERRHAESRGQVAELNGTAGALDSKSRELLRRFSDFHAQRVKN